MEQFINRYNSQISFSLSCYDRLIITGCMPDISYAAGMTNYLYSKGIRIFDYAKFAEGLRDNIRKQTDTLSKENEVEVQYLNKSGIRKESPVSAILKKRGDHPGVVCIFSSWAWVIYASPPGVRSGCRFTLTGIICWLTN
jgi:hypothetical protein